jgi:hypothetical protein
LGETVVFETVLGAGLWRTFVDANQLENVLLNLVVNARDAMPNGGHLTIESSNAYLDDAYAARFGDVVPGQYVLLSVTDTGSGMSPELLARVFEPFFSTKGDRQGSGLGLAMVHGFVKQSGGHIRIYSELNDGTSVKIYLPRIKAAEAAANPEELPQRDPRIETAANRSETVLVVEDNDDVRQYAQSALEELGYTVLQARDAAEGLGLKRGGDLWRALGPAGDHAAKHHQADVHRYQHRADNDGGKHRVRDAQPRRLHGQRAEHDAHDDGGNDRRDQRPRQIQEGDEQQEKDTGGEQRLRAAPERLRIGLHRVRNARLLRAEFGGHAVHGLSRIGRLKTVAVAATTGNDPSLR